MATYKRKLKDVSGNFIIPATRSVAVYMDNNQDLESYLKQKYWTVGINSRSSAITIHDNSRIITDGHLIMGFIEFEYNNGSLPSQWNRIAELDDGYNTYLGISVKALTVGQCLNGNNICDAGMDTNGNINFYPNNKAEFTDRPYVFSINIYGFINRFDRDFFK